MYSKMKNFEHLKWHTLSVTKHNYLSSAKRCYKYPLHCQGPPPVPKRCYKYPLHWQGPPPSLKGVANIPFSDKDPHPCLPAKQTYLSLGVFGESLAVWVWKPWTLGWFVEFYFVRLSSKTKPTLNRYNKTNLTILYLLNLMIRWGKLSTFVQFAVFLHNLLGKVVECKLIKRYFKG